MIRERDKVTGGAVTVTIGIAETAKAIRAVERRAGANILGLRWLAMNTYPVFITCARRHAHALSRHVNFQISV